MGETPDRNKPDFRVHFAALVSGVLLAIGCLLPWAQFSALISIPGYRMQDGAIVLTIAVVAGAIGAYNLTAKRDSMIAAYLALGVTAFALVSFDAWQIARRASSALDSYRRLQIIVGQPPTGNMFEMLGGGLIVAGLGSVGLISTGIWGFAQSFRARSSQPLSRSGIAYLKPSATFIEAAGGILAISAISWYCISDSPDPIMAVVNWVFGFVTGRGH